MLRGMKEEVKEGEVDLNLHHSNTATGQHVIIRYDSVYIIDIKR